MISNKATPLLVVAITGVAVAAGLQVPSDKPPSAFTANDINGFIIAIGGVLAIIFSGVAAVMTAKTKTKVDAIGKEVNGATHAAAAREESLRKELTALRAEMARSVQTAAVLAATPTTVVTPAAVVVTPATTVVTPAATPNDPTETKKGDAP